MFVSGIMKSNKMICSVQMDNDETLCGAKSGSFYF